MRLGALPRPPRPSWKTRKRQQADLQKQLEAEKSRKAELEERKAELEKKIAELSGS